MGKPNKACPLDEAPHPISLVLLVQLLSTVCNAQYANATLLGKTLAGASFIL